MSESFDLITVIGAKINTTDITIHTKLVELCQGWPPEEEKKYFEPPNVRDHRAGRCDVAKQKRLLWPAPVHRLVGRLL